MGVRSIRGLLACVLVIGVVPADGFAQVADLGTRAQGMAGAFVAVADDASAVYWNPAGLGGAVVVGAVIELGQGRTEPGDPPVAAGAGAEAARRDTRLVAFAAPPLGLSYYRVSQAGALVLGGAEVTPDDRQIEGRDVSLRAVETRQFGVTLVQSLTAGVVLGTTVRFVRGGATGFETGRPGSWRELADEARDLDTGGEAHVDLDAGLMVGSGRMRLGLVAHNLRQPSFPVADGSGTVTLPRHARLGLAYGTGWPGSSRLIVAVDADLTRTATLGPARRDVAAGVEGWGLRRRVGLRGGVRSSTIGEARPVATVGLSVGVTSGLFVDAHLARGRDDRDRVWSVGGRITY